MSGIWRFLSQSIFGRTFALMLAAVLVAEAIGLGLNGSRPSGSSISVSLSSIAHALRQPDDHGSPGPGPDGPPGPPPGGAGGPPPEAPGPPPQSGLMARFSNAPPAAADLTPAPRLQTALAQQLHSPLGAVVFLATNADEHGADTEPGYSDAILRKSFLAARQMRDGRWWVIENRVQGFPTTLQRRALLLGILGIGALAPLAWLFAHALSAPLLRFAEAAQRVGRDGSAGLLPREGPTEMLLAVDAFNSMQARLNRMLQERTHMVGAIAHDLRTPLTRLAFRLDDLPAPLGDKVSADIEEMKLMISAALDFIRDRSLNAEREQLDFRLLVESIVDDQTDVGYPVTLEPGAPITLQGSRLALRRLVGNLIDNALKYGERARLRLQVLGGRCILEVDDDGPGIPESLQQRVFDPFFRMEPSRNRDTGGSGLGLASVYAIVMDHGGEITLANRNGGGLRVSVSLPAIPKS